MGRSPAPVARGPGRLLSARDPPGANKAAESHTPRHCSPRRPLPPRAHVIGARAPRRRVRARTGRGLRKRRLDPASPRSR